MEEELLALMQQLQQPHVPNEADEMFHFTLGIVPIMNKFNAWQKLQAKIRILNILASIEKGNQHHPVPAMPSHGHHPYSFNSAHSLSAEPHCHDSSSSGASFYEDL